MVHVTHESNQSSIDLNGLMLDFCETKYPAIWCVESSRALNALEHVSARHGWPIQELLVVAFEANRKELRRYGKSPYYRIKRDIRPSEILSYSKVALVPV